jgi:hypothetical protein
MRILYLDKSKDRLLYKALSRHGTVDFATDINQAMLRMADKDFDYYFVEADVPSSQPFLKHLRHDPQLAAPWGVILLTSNEEEDCEAWCVDTFLNRNTAVADLPYVFSHLKGEKQETASIIRLARLEPVTDEPEHDEPDPVRSKVAQQREPEPEPEQEAGPESTDPRDHIAARRTSEVEPAPAPLLRERASIRGGSVKRLLLVSIIIASAVAWLFAYGPLNSKHSNTRSSGKKKVEAESDSKGRARLSLPVGYASQTTPSMTSAQSSPASATQSGQAEADATGIPTDSGDPAHNAVPAPSPAPAPAPEPVNHGPSVSISGGGTVPRGQSYTFSASYSDPDGDSCSLSWSPSQTVFSESEGSITVTVTATDSHGASSSDSATVTFI